MPPIDKPKVKIKIKSRFESNGRLYGPGIWEVDPAVSLRLVREGKATLVNAQPAAAKAPPATSTAKTPPADPAKNPRIPPATEPEGDAPTSTPLPEGFPFQATLAVAGFDSVESLQVPNVKEELAKIETLTPADITKIGLAISKA